MNFIKPVLSLIPFVLILSERRFKTAGKYLFLYLACFVLERIALTTLSGLLSFVVLAITSIMTRFAPGIMTGAYLLSSTSVSEFIGSMERMHLTEKNYNSYVCYFSFLPHNQRRIPGNPGRNENERHTIWWEKPIFNGGIPSCTADGVRCKNWG